MKGTHERNAANRTHFSFSHFFPQLSMAAAGYRNLSCLFFHQYYYSQNCRRVYCCRPNRWQISSQDHQTQNISVINLNQLNNKTKT